MKLEKPSISVLMSVYKNDNPGFLREAIKSMIEQSYAPDEFVIVEDGPLPEAIRNVLDEYQRKYEGLFYRIKLENNQGLGIALGIGVKHCKNNLIARMDSDDLACSNRLELQITEFLNDPSLELVGGMIEEFYDSPEKIAAKRTVPLVQNEIYKRVKTRTPFNHVTVMFKKSAVLSVGNYPKVRFAQDYYLWIEMIHAKCHMKNIEDTLVLVRTGSDMFKRRGGKQYYLLEKELQNKMYQYGMINNVERVRNLIIRRTVRCLGTGGRKFIYATFLRR